MASTHRDKELARQRAERQAARQAAAAVRTRQRNAVLGSAAAVVLVGVAATSVSLGLPGSGRETTQAVAASAPARAASPEPSAGTAAGTPAAPASTAPAATPGATATPAAGGGCTYTRTTEPAARPVLLPPTVGVELEKVYDVTIATDRGDVVFEMDSAVTPCTANNLRSLAHFRYFDGTSCHRLTTDSIRVLQCGDPTATGYGGPGYQFGEEALEGATYPRGTVAMAHSGPGTNGSQFFIVYGDSNLPANYTPFGVVRSGMDVLDAVAAAGSDGSNGMGDGKPKRSLTITTLRAAEHPA